MRRVRLGADMNRGTCGREGVRAEFFVGTNTRGEIYRCPRCGKTGTIEEIEYQKDENL
jgi:cation transport regulator ChaC